MNRHEHTHTHARTHTLVFCDRPVLDHHCGWGRHVRWAGLVIEEVTGLRSVTEFWMGGVTLSG